MSESIEEAVQRINKWIAKQLIDMQSLTYIPFRFLLMISIMDAFAQQEANYPNHGNATVFAKFLIRYGGEYSIILTEICPVTLFYHKREEYSFRQLKLTYARIFSAGDEELAAEATRLCNLIPIEKRAMVANAHRYAYLIYAMRSKVVHELNYINAPINFQQKDAYQLPHISTRHNRMLGSTENSVIDPYSWTLHIPEQFIERVLLETTSNYLKACKNDNRIPFANHSEDRRCQLAWYD